MLKFMKMNDLKESLEDDDTYIEELINLIPPEYYFEGSVKRNIIEKRHRTTNKKLKGLKRKRKLSKMGKHKFARLDPQQQKTVSQILQHELDNDGKKPQKMSKMSPAVNNRATNLKELREKLKLKTEAFLGKRKNAEMKKAEQSPEEKQRMKKPKKKLKQVAINSKHEKTNKVSKNKSESGQAKKPNYNKENKILYSKFETEGSGAPRKKSEYTGKNPEKLLKKTLKERAKEKELEASSPTKALLVKEKTAWRKAIDRAQGVKVKDDPELLKRSINRRKQQKKQSQKKWEERKNFTKKLQERRQQKRKENIKAKKQEKINKKIKKAKKKGRIF